MKPLLQLKDLVDKLPAVKPAKPATIQPPAGMNHCACGKKFIPIGEIKIVKTPHCTAIDTMCRECRQQCSKHSLIVCVRCKSVAAKLAPHRDNSGFVFEPGKPYHTPFCPNCVQDCVTSPIAEKAIWDQDQKRK